MHVIEAAGLQSLNGEREAKRLAVSTLLGIPRHDSTSPGLTLQRGLALAQAMQRVGDHAQALRELDTLPRDRPSDTHVDFLKAKSLERLGRVAEALAIYEAVLPEFEAAADPRRLAYGLLEYGRALAFAKRSAAAQEAWRRSADILSGMPGEDEHYGRALSNLAGELLKSSDAEERHRGEKMMERASDFKAGVGDIEGLATNYSRLSLYYFAERRFERAIAYARREVWLTRRTGDETELAGSLGNLAIIYVETLQLGAARAALNEARDIADRLSHDGILRMVTQNLAAAEHAGRKAGQQGLVVGPKAACACESGQIFVECCGRADFEPDGPPLPGFAGFSQDAAAFSKGERRGDSPGAWLDHVLRDTEESRRRFSWSELVGHDGWMEVFELPDMAQMHLLAAKALAESAATEDGGFHGPLGACILSVAAAEAFINSLSFFLCEAAKSPNSSVSPEDFPEGLLDDVHQFQRHTELTQKWIGVGQAICAEGWPDAAIWREFQVLVAIRNELVHFKALDYERVVPPAKAPPRFLRDLPDQVEMRNVPHSWPARLLTPSFASWCVALTESLIVSMKESYASARRDEVTDD